MKLFLRRKCDLGYLQKIDVSPKDRAKAYGAILKCGLFCRKYMGHVFGHAYFLIYENYLNVIVVYVKALKGESQHRAVAFFHY